MANALGTLLQGGIDLVGGTTSGSYLAFRSGPFGWLAGRFVCSTDELIPLANSLSRAGDAGRLGLAVTGRVSHDEDGWEDALEHDARVLNDFISDVGDHIEIESFEIRVPEHEHLDRYLEDLRGFDSVDVFVELPWRAAMRDSIAQVVQSDFALVKARTGDADASDTPGAEAVAEFIHSATNLDWQFTLSGGFRHLFTPSQGAKSHGIVNVFGGTVLTLAEDLSWRELQTILLAPSSDWRFGPETIACREFEASTEDIEAARDLLCSIAVDHLPSVLREAEAMKLGSPN